MSHPVTVRLGDVASIVRGITFRPDDVVPLGTPGSVACMRTKNVQVDLDLGDVWAVAASFVKRNDQYLHEGDILLSSANSWNLVGKCCWIPALPWRATLGGFVSALRAKPGEVDPRYLFHWFGSGWIQTTVRSFGQQTTNISNLNIERCLSLQLLLPPLPEQRRIAAILDQAMALRTKRSVALTRLDTLVQSIFLDTFGDPVTNPKAWPKRSIGGLSKGGPSNGLFRKNSEYGSGDADGLPVVWVEDLFRGDSIDTTAARRIVPQDSDLTKYGLKTGDLLFCRSSLKLDGIAYSNLYLGPDASALFECHIIRLSPDLSLVSPVFLNSVLRMPQLRAIAKSKAKTATMTTIDQQGLCSIEVPLPPIELQQVFEDRATAVWRHKRVHAQSLKTLAALFASLQQRAFRGQL